MRRKLGGGFYVLSGELGVSQAFLARWYIGGGYMDISLADNLHNCNHAHCTTHWTSLSVAAWSLTRYPKPRSLVRVLFECSTLSRPLTGLAECRSVRAATVGEPSVCCSTAVCALPSRN